MKKIIRKLAAAVTAGAVTLSAVAFDVPLKIFAAGTHTDHKVCVGSNHAECSHGSTTWKAWSNSTQLPSSGTYYLDTDVTLSGNALITQNLTLCLNGHTVKTSVKDRLLHVYQGSLTLCDCKGGGMLTGANIDGNSGAAACINNGATFNMYSGAISGNTVSKYNGAAVWVTGAEFNMYGGTISDNTTDKYGGGVYVVSNSNYSGKFTMTGGTISGNKAGSYGGGVYVVSGGSFTMSGGTISGNTANDGAGVCVTGSEGVFTLNGGTISNNIASLYGGGVYVYSRGNFTMESGTISNNTASNYGGGAAVNSGVITMNGGTISGNTTTGSGGGVDNVGTFTVNGGTISGNKATSYGGGVYNRGTMTLNGKVTITENTRGSGGYNANIYLPSGKTITIGSNFSTASVIGVYTAVTPDCTNLADVTAWGEGVTAKDISKGFTADKDGQSIVYENNAVKLEGGHSWGKWEITKEPTTTAAGTAKHTCTINTAHTETQTLPKLTDTTVWTKTTTQPTCTKDGSDVYKSTYGTVTVTIKATGHNITHTDAKEATCTATGNIEYWYCSDCEKYFSDSEYKTEITQSATVTPIIPHTWSEDYQHDADNHWQVCTVCITEDDKLAHVWDDGEVKTEATEIEDGEMLYTCTVCKDTKTTVIPKKDHDHNWNEAWSTDGNYHWHECTVCGTHDKDISHNWELSEVIKEPTCTEGGTEKYICECGRERTKDIAIDPEAHDWSDWTITVPTVKETGRAERVCSNDSAHKETKILPVLSTTDEDGENVWKKNVEESKAPTMTEPGIIVYESEEYGRIEVEVPPLGGTDNEGGESVWEQIEEESTGPTMTEPGIIVYESEEYGRIEVEVPPLGETDSEDSKRVWEQNKEESTPPTATEPGLIVYESEYGRIEVEVPPLGETDEENGESVWEQNEEESIPPTMTEPGTIVYESEYGRIEIEVPPLEDGDFWDLDDSRHIDPTEDQPGQDVYISEYGEVVVTIPPTGKPDNPYNPDDENISKEVQSGENAPDTTLVTPLDKLIDAVLTPEEKELADTGVEVKIVLTVEDGTSSVPAEDKAKTEAAIRGISGCNLGQYLEINLLKIIGDDQKKVTETNAPITLMFVIPEALRGEGRTYSVIRVHNGETAVLSDMDSDMNTITIETDKFSTYTLAYSKKTSVTPPGGGSSGGDFTVPDESGSGSGDTAPGESGTTDGSGSEASGSESADGNGSEAGGNEPTDSSNTNPDESELTNGSNSASGENNSTGGVNTLSENGGSFGNGTAAPDGEASSVNNGTNPNGGTAAGNDGGSASSGSAYNNGSNPATGIAVSFIPLAVSFTVLAVTVKRKKK